MNLLVSYNHLHTNWYVGEIYRRILDELYKIEGINIEYITMPELSEKTGIPLNYNGNFPSILNHFNLIIQNKDNGKTFVHSWHDYAPVMLEDMSGINKLNVVKFACVSRLDEQIIDRFKDKIIIQPTVYLLELFDEHLHIEKYRNTEKTDETVYFNGLCHSDRMLYKTLLDDSEHFTFLNKNEDYRNKIQYYEELSNHKFGLSLDGAAKICYRDLEYFGLGILNLRERLNLVMYEPLIENKHYITLFDENIKSVIRDPQKKEEALDLVEKKFLEIKNNEELIKNITEEARLWFERNCLPENQIKIILSFLDNLEIFK